MKNSNASPANHYEALGVETTATATEIKNSFRKLAMAYHPDKNPDDAYAVELFKRINIAYETLKAPELRIKYDRLLQSKQYKDPAYADLRKPETVTPKKVDEPQPRRGDNIRNSLQLTLAELNSTPIIKEYRYSRLDKCPQCSGSGHDVATKSKPITCHSCKGSGFTERHNGQMKVRQPCQTCHNTGYIFDHGSCQLCLGSGRMVKSRKIEITIPPGSSQSTTLRSAKGGHIGVWGGDFGDLLLDLEVQLPEGVKISGNNIEMKLPLDPLLMMIGGKLSIPIQDEPIKIPAGIKAGEKIILKGKGLPDKKITQAGDLVFTIEVEWPQALSEKQANAIRDIARSINSEKNLPMKAQAMRSMKQIGGKKNQ